MFTSLRVFLIAVTCVGGAQVTVAQDTAPLQSHVVVIDQERLFSETVFGLRLSKELEAASRMLAEENRTIEQMLINEERALTEQRPSMPPEAFREAADAFDERVTEVRTAQDRKARIIAERRDAERRAFLDAALPILGGLMAEYGAFVVLDLRQVFLSDDRVNVTDEAIALIDAALGERVTPAPRPDWLEEQHSATQDDAGEEPLESSPTAPAEN
ncbi:MAG: OmpH family outer membrane protein [Dinoroseobacter sp.]|nr:OmpH family outer membrane protein [Dinoroseobacter sp.]